MKIIKREPKQLGKIVKAPKLGVILNPPTLTAKPFAAVQSLVIVSSAWKKEQATLAAKKQRDDHAAFAKASLAKVASITPVKQEKFEALSQELFKDAA